MWHIVRTDRVEVAHITRILYGWSPGAQPCFRSIVHQVRIGVSDTELQAVAQAPVKANLQGVVVALAVRKIAPIDLLVLRPRSQRLRHRSSERRVRWRGESRRRGDRVRNTVCEEPIPQ